ncbi:S8 family peptidase [Sphingomicrobium flavum]|uniref:S8 family peptidase n=1 Tax=Sphingomicrobium flavum TaxID=1229164 RepID=UPI0021AD8ED2|nr:S8 family serine peptidase [Sphingomicrobium flavum]
MTKKLAIGTATIAIMASLSSPAIAQEANGGVAITGNEALAAASSDSSGQVVAMNAVDPFYGDIDPFYGDIDPFYGDISPFYGDIGAFWGHINPFYGDINPFYGDINPFYGDISPFYGNINPFYGNISPFYGDIRPFWGDITAFYGNIAPFDSKWLESIGNFWVDASSVMHATNSQWAALQSANALDPQYAAVRLQLEDLIARSKAQWGAKVTEKTGQSFETAFVAELFARHGVDMNDLGSLAEMSDLERSAFFLDWHDSLMGYSGLDHVDHWMGAVNWTPAITHIQGSGATSIIGIVDGSFASDVDLGNNIKWMGGSNIAVGGHGAGVASLIAGAHDGEGVMGIAPNAMIATYNPFDADGTTSWESVQKGVEALIYDAYIGGNDTGYASIINLSLGESGWAMAQGMADMLASDRIAAYHHETIYVLAAGNDGVSQTADIEWNFANDASFILVGSVDPTGTVSAFSNQPGSACLLDNGVCRDENQLYMRTVVAPGEMLLVLDGNGGVVRRSGTSFAAPLVSGAIALMHDRWNWLAKHPEETAEIIFRSARDLGAPGPDEVYGWGMLDVAASQSPLDFNNLEFTVYQKRGRSYRSSTTSAGSLLQSSTNGLPGWWETDNVYFSMIERIGDTHRDFLVPMSSSTYGMKSKGSYLQDFISARFATWLNSHGVDRDGDGTAGFSDIRSASAGVPGGWTMRYDSAMPRVDGEGRMHATHMAATLSDPDGKMSFTLGYGQGAQALAGDGRGLFSDYDRNNGGVNPILGFASGENFAAMGYQLTGDTKITLGYSDNRLEGDEVQGLSEVERMAMERLDAHTAHAFTADIEHRVADKMTLGLQYTHLRENEALLGIQSTVDGLLGTGTSTQALTASLAIDTGAGIQIDLSATGARTDARDGQAFATGKGVWSSAGQLALTKTGLLGKADRLRLAVSQPLNVENGDVEFTQLGVVDRQTGELGEWTQSFGIETKRRYAGELLYAAPIADSADLALFGRYQSEGQPGETENYVIGGTINLRF